MTQKQDSLLTNGKIPAGTECPFKDQCCNNTQFNNCLHQGIAHKVEFSCGMARAFDLTKRGN